MAHGRKTGQPMRLLDAVIEVNEQQSRQVVSLLRKHYPSLGGVRVAVLGLSFRSGTNDMRESPAIPILRALASEGAALKAYDPAAREEAREVFRDDSVHICDDLSETVCDAQAIVLVTRWDEFHRLPKLLKQHKLQPIVVDGRRILDKTEFAQYEGIGL